MAVWPKLWIGPNSCAWRFRSNPRYCSPYNGPLRRSLADPYKKTICTVLIMYCIRKDSNGVTLVCLACPHTDRVQDFNRSSGNQRTLAAHAMLKHVHAEHSRETHVRAMAMVMERQHAPR